MNNVHIVKTGGNLQGFQPAPGRSIDPDKQSIGRIVLQLVAVHDGSHATIVRNESKITFTTVLITGFRECGEFKGIGICGDGRIGTQAQSVVGNLRPCLRKVNRRDHSADG